MTQTRFRIALLLTVASVECFSAEPESSSGEKSPLEIDLLTSFADDYSDFTGGVGWDLDLLLKSDATADFEYPEEKPIWFWRSNGRIQSRGALLEDESLNQDAITLHLQFYTSGRLLSPLPGGFSEDTVISDDPFDDTGVEYRPPAEDEVSRSLKDFWSLRLGLDGGLEADQAFDNLLYRISAFGMFRNRYHLRETELSNSTDRLLTLLPTLEVALDGVHQAEALATETGALPEEDYLRFRAVASWRYSLGQHFSDLSSGWSVLDSLELYGALQYSADLDQNEAWKAAGLDEAFGWLVELTYDLLDLKGTVLFARASGGRIAPILEDDQSFLVGVRYRF